MTYSFTDGGDGSLHVFRDGTYLCSIHGSEVSVVKNTTQSVVELSDSEHVFISINVNQVSGATTLQDIVDAIEVALPNDSDGGGGGGGGDIKSDGSVNFVGPETWNNGGADSVIIDTTNIELDSATNQAFITPAGFSTANAGAGTSAQIGQDGTIGLIDGTDVLAISPTTMHIPDTFTILGGAYTSLIDVDAVNGVIVVGDKNNDNSHCRIIVDDNIVDDNNGAINTYSNQGFAANSPSGSLYGQIDTNGITTSQGDLTATAAWKLGNVQAVTFPDTAIIEISQYIEVEIGGTVYKLAVAQVV